MNLYLLTITKPTNFQLDSVRGFIIRALTEDSARLQASAAARDEGPIMWLDEKTAACHLLTSEGPTGIILRDFHAG